MAEMTVDSIIKFLAKSFDEPCNFTFNGVDIDVYMSEHCWPWCEERCDDAKPYDCWRKFLETWMEEHAEEYDDLPTGNKILSGVINVENIPNYKLLEEAGFEL